MNMHVKPPRPRPDGPYFTIPWKDLEMAWQMLAAPERQTRVTETLEALRTLSQTTPPEKTVFTMVAATAWLLDGTSEAGKPGKTP